MSSANANSGGAPLAGNINVALGKGELPTATLSHPSGASCEVVLTGAHVTSWKTRDGIERLFVSSASGFGPGVAIRGGIPVCFPQFSGRGDLPKHGFVRTSDAWEIETMSSEGDACTLVLTLTDSEATRAVWPHKFTLRYSVVLTADRLDTSMQVVNLGDEALVFSAALHTYFAVADVTAARVAGLGGLTYEDNAAGGACAVEEPHEELSLRGEVDRVYRDAPPVVQLRQHGLAPSSSERLMIRKSDSFRDVVLWNLGEAKAAGMKDLGEGQWQQYVCLEAGAISTPVKLEPGASFEGTQSFACEP